MKKKFLKLILLFALMIPLSGCAAMVAAFPTIAAIVSDATAVLSIIQQAVNTWFARKPNPELQAQFNTVITEAWSALRIATSATNGAKNLSQEDYDKAFADFQDAYSRLHSMLKEHGILKGSRLSMGDSDQEIDIPEPLAMSYKVN